MTRIHRITIGFVGCVLLVSLLLTLFLPTVCKSIGWWQYHRAEKLNQRIGEAVANEYPPPGETIPDATIRRINKLTSRRETSYQRAVAAFSAARSLRSSALNDRDLVALANSHIGALGGSYPPLQTISEWKQTVTSARSELETALQLNSENKDAYSALIHFYLREPEPNPEKAVDVCRKFEKRFPDDPDMHASYGYALENSHDRDSAMQHFLKAVELDPLHTANIQLSWLFARDGNLDEAIEVLEKFIKRKPSLGLRSAQVQMDHLSRARDRIAQSEAALSQNPNDIEAIKILAEAHSRIGAEEMALHWLERAYELNPNDSDVIWRLALKKSTMGKAEAAIELYDILLDNAEKPISRESILILLGDASFKAGDSDKALACYKKAVESTPHASSWALFHLAKYYDKIGNDKLAEEYSRKYVEHRKRDEELLANIRALLKGFL